MRLRLLLLVLVVLLLPKPAAADLIDRGNGIIYSTELDTMFLQDLSTPFTTGYRTSQNGAMTFFDTLVWIEYLNWSSYLGYNDWELPRNLPDLFYGELGNVRRGQPGWSATQSMEPFTNTRMIYWTDVWLIQPERNQFWGATFDTAMGMPDAWPLDTELWATAQRRGAPIGVPEPSTLSLVALAGFAIGMRRFRSRRSSTAALMRATCSN